MNLEATTDAPETHRTDEDLLLACRDGDPEAWRVLVARYERLVHAVALRNGVDEHDAADITQATFVALFQALPSVNDPDRLGSWLSTVARRHAWRVRDQRRRFSPFDDASAHAHDPVARRLDELAVRDALAQLNPEEKELIWHLFFDPEQLDYAEIARRLDRAIGGIGPMRGRSLAKMRGLLEAA